MLSIIQDPEAQPSYTCIGITFAIVSLGQFISLKSADRGGHSLLRSWLSSISSKLNGVVKRCRIELADPLEIIRVGIRMTKAKNPNHVFSALTRSRIAEIEREININVQVKSVMIDIEEAPVISENPRVDVELITRLMKLAGLSSSS